MNWLLPELGFSGTPSAIETTTCPDCGEVRASVLVECGVPCSYCMDGDTLSEEAA